MASVGKLHLYSGEKKEKGRAFERRRKGAVVLCGRRLMLDSQAVMAHLRNFPFYSIVIFYGTVSIRRVYGRGS